MEENTTHCKFTTTFEVDRDQTPVDAFDTIKYIRGWWMRLSIQLDVMALTDRPGMSMSRRQEGVHRGITTSS